METTETTIFGDIHISQRVISLLAAGAARRIPNVADLEATLTETAARKMGRTQHSYGVETAISGQDIEITVRIVVVYGCRIPDVALAVQKAVKETVEQMTGCQVTAVHIAVQAVVFSSVGIGGAEHGPEQ